MNLRPQLDGTQKVVLRVRVEIRVPQDVRLIEDGGLKLAPPLGVRFADDGTGRRDFDEAAVETELRHRLIDEYPGEYLWHFVGVEVEG